MNENTDRIPREAIVPIVIRNLNDNLANYPSINGTGFYVKIDNIFDYVFFVTAKHCLRDFNPDEHRIILFIPEYRNELQCIEKIRHDSIINHGVEDSPYDFSIVMVSKLTCSPEQFSRLLDNAIIIHNYKINEFLDVNDRRKLVKVAGFPVNLGKDEKEIIYDDEGGFISKITLRGFYGDILNDGFIEDYYSIINIESEIEDKSGFSGSPVLYFSEAVDYPIVLGVVSMQGNKKVRFLSMDVVYGTILSFLDSVQQKSDI